MSSAIVKETVNRHNDTLLPKRPAGSEKIMLKTAGIIAAGGLLMLLLNACDADQPNVQPTQAPQPEPAQTFVFSCDDDLEFVTRLEGDNAWLFLPSGTLKLQKTSADNYRSKDITLQIKGQESQRREHGDKR